MNSTGLPSPTPRPRGIALVVVLSMLALVTILVIAFFSSVTTDFSAAKAYSNGESAKQLADSAVNLVMAQIKDATTGFDRDASGNLVLSRRLAWASQPGMVRTWDDSGAATKCYKLFSSDQMVVTGSYNASADTTGTGTAWNSLPAIYTDLNSPVLIRDDAHGDIVWDSKRPSEKYTATAPIIDPNNLVDASTLTPAGPAGTLTYCTNNAGKPDIEGFTVAKAATYDDSKPLSPANNPVPMPVKWIYVLQDGQLTVPTVSGSDAKFDTPGQPVPSAKNPIVGRIAFWADDESSKINVNTASEGVFWDVPVCASLDEMQFAANPPTKGEYQRVPGHPAMTCLSSVLGSGTLAINHGILSSSEISTFTANLQKIYDFTPRVMSGSPSAGTTQGHGSQGGTAPIADRNYGYAPQVGDLYPNRAGSGAQNIVLPEAIETGTTRLFTTIDDILFKPDRTLQDSAVITAKALKQDRFFLTANSRAPEVTLFNTPRVSLWPITWPYRSAHLLSFSQWKTANRLPSSNGDPSNPLSVLLNVPLSGNSTNSTGRYIAPQEQLLAFCSQIGKDSSNIPRRYFFQRQNPDSPTWDYDNIQRNKDLLGTYLTRLTGASVPGFGGSFTGKYGTAGRDAILINVFDSIRSLNMSTSGTDASGKSSTLYDFTGMYFTADATGTTGYRDMPTWQIAPMRIDLGSGAKKSVGQFPTVAEAALFFYATKRNDPYPVGIGSADGPFDASKLITATNPQTTEMRMVVFINEYSPGGPYITPSYWIKAEGSPFSVNGSSVGFPSANGNLVQMKEAVWTSCFSFINRFYTGSYAPHTPKSFDVGGSDPTAYRRWEFVSNPIPIDPTNGTMFNFTGSTVTFTVYPLNPAKQDNASHIASATPIQTIKIDFSKLNGPAAVPLAPRWVEGQSIPAAAVTTNSGTDGLIKATGSNSLFYANLAQGHREVARRGIYLYQDEGFTAGVFSTGTYAYNNAARGKIFAGKQISTSWARRMACEGSVSNSYVVTSADVPDLPLMDGTVQAANYPAYYPANVGKGNAGDGFYGATSVISPYDTVLSMAIDPTGPAKGDVRVIAAMTDVPSTYFAPACPGSSADYYLCSTANYPRTTEGWQRHTMSASSPTDAIRASNRWGSGKSTAANDDKISLIDSPMATVGYGLTGASGNHTVRGFMGQQGEVGVAAFGRTVAINRADPIGDWTNRPGNFPDGGCLWFPDQFFATLGSLGTTSANTEAYVPFFAHINTGDDISQSVNFFSPNRQVSSGVALFGTFPAPDNTGTPQPWQTLLFCPNPAVGTAHPGFGALGSKVPDHLLLDLFWMPIVEPYAISEPFSTAGKVNLNYQIVPFSNIVRKTGLYAVLKSAKITAIPSAPSTMPANYKSAYNMRNSLGSVATRLTIDTAETLKAFDTKFSANDIFRSASQICEMFLVPTGQSLSNVQSLGGGFWSTQKLTGDNSREAPYGHIYPRVTTKSNTFQVHYKVQLLKKRTNSDQTVWVEGRDRVVSEYRGSTILERYVDPNDATLPDFATKPLSDADAVIDRYYRFRVVGNKVFMP